MNLEDLRRIMPGASNERLTGILAGLAFLSPRQQEATFEALSKLCPDCQAETICRSSKVGPARCTEYRQCPQCGRRFKRVVAVQIQPSPDAIHVGE